jgi:hypothetical protein
LGVHAEVAHVRPGPHWLPQLPQFAASFVGSTHFELQAILGRVHTSVMHWLLLQTLPPVQSVSLQQAKQPVPAQQFMPAEHCADEQAPLVHVSVVHESPSLH